MLENEVTQMRAENGATREELRKLEEQQETILQLMNDLQRKLDGRPAAIAEQSPPAPQTEPLPAAQSAVPPKPACAVRPVTKRNDFNLNRNMFQFTAHILDKRVQYNLSIRASNTSAAVVVGGFVRRTQATGALRAAAP